MNVIWTDGSQDDLQSIREYISQDNPIVAQQIAAAIIETGNTLEELPRRGREGRVVGTYELVMTKLPYTIAYSVVDDRVEIIRVIHHARLWPDML